MTSLDQPGQAPQFVRRLPEDARLLQVDPDLGEGVTDTERGDAERHAVLPLVTVTAGPWEPHALADVPGVEGEVLGFLIVRGMATINVMVANRVCSRLLPPAEFILLDGIADGVLPTRWGWTALIDTRVMVFDQRMLAIGRRWPGVMANLTKRAAIGGRYAVLQQAISQLPRVEDRLLGLFWSLADRSGVVTAGGVRIDLPVTHDTLAQLIGAQRPTVSLGLTHLQNLGLIRAVDGGWLLQPDSLSRFSTSVPPDADDPSTGT